MSQTILIAYYSHSGNTEKIAEAIQQEVGGTLFQIESEPKYPEDYDTVVKQAKKEIDSGFMPELKQEIPDMESYDVIFIGSPNWWSTIAPPVARFLTECSLAEKTIVPFCTHGGGGAAKTASDVKRLCPDSTVLDGFAVYGDGGARAVQDIREWLEQIGIKTAGH